MLKENVMNKKPPMVPYSTSTYDFEDYLPTSPVLSSREAGWQHLMLRTYHEPSDLEETFFPGGPDIYLVLVTSGRVLVEERKLYGPWRQYAIQAGDWYLSPAGGEPYALRWKSQTDEPLHTLHLHLNCELFTRTVQQLVDRDPLRMVIEERTGFQDGLLHQLALALQMELQFPGSGSLGNLYTETTAQLLLAHLLRHYVTNTAPLHDFNGKLSSLQMRRLTTFIQEHLHQKLSLEMLAQQVDFSPYHFARLFRQTTGESPHQFILRQRISTAERLLVETTFPLAQVASAVGIPNQSHFTQLFKRHVGVTPLVYRQEH